jgi:hypothetical protein
LGSKLTKTKRGDETTDGRDDLDENEAHEGDDGERQSLTLLVVGLGLGPCLDSRRGTGEGCGGGVD